MEDEGPKRKVIGHHWKAHAYLYTVEVNGPAIHLCIYWVLKDTLSSQFNIQMEDDGPKNGVEQRQQ
jgi:hypothetical protein